MIIDTHCHLTDEAFASDAEACIVRAREAGVGRMVLACCEEAELPAIARLCASHPDVVYGAIGIHPENMAADVTAQAASMRAWLETATDTFRPVAIGEIGIDLHWDKTRLDDQLQLLRLQLDWARQLDLPVLLHIRDAMREFLDFLRAYINIYNKDEQTGQNHAAASPRLRGILHCYSGTADEAQEALQLGDFCFGIGGTLTYKRSQVPDVARALGLERIVLETDAPYLAPVPHRGKRNEPAYTADTARFLADVLQCTPDEVARQTTANAQRLMPVLGD